MRVLMIAGVVLFFALIIGGIAWAGGRGSSREGKRELRKANEDLRETNQVLNSRLYQAEKVLDRIHTLASEDRAIEASILSTQVIDEVLQYRRELGT